MSFNICLNSVDGREIVPGVKNQIEYNFAFDKTPEHKGGYKVSFSFASLRQDTDPFTPKYNEMCVYVDLGAYNSYRPKSTFTGTENTQLLGIVRVGQQKLQSIQTQWNQASPATSVASIPANSATDAYTLSETTSRPTASVYLYYPMGHSYDAFFYDNKHIYLPAKPTRNQFNVTLSFLNGVLYNELIANYTLLISFEAV